MKKLLLSAVMLFSITAVPFAQQTPPIIKQPPVVVVQNPRQPPVVRHTSRGYTNSLYHRHGNYGTHLRSIKHVKHTKHAKHVKHVKHVKHYNHGMKKDKIEDKKDE